MSQRIFSDLPQNEPGLVDKFLGTSYDVVKTVYDNLEKFEALYGVLQEIEDLAEGILDELMVPIRIELAGYIAEAKAWAEQSEVSATSAATSAAEASASADRAEVINRVFRFPFVEGQAQYDVTVLSGDPDVTTTGLTLWVEGAIEYAFTVDSSTKFTLLTPELYANGAQMAIIVNAHFDDLTANLAALEQQIETDLANYQIQFDQMMAEFGDESTGAVAEAVEAISAAIPYAHMEVLTEGQTIVNLPTDITTTGMSLIVEGSVEFDYIVTGINQITLPGTYSHLGTRIWVCKGIPQGSISNLFASRADLIAPTGSTMLGHGSGTVAEFLDTTQEITKTGLAFKKSIRLKLPLKFPGYFDARTASGGGSGDAPYPQGHCYDSAENVYIHYSSTTKNIIAWYTKLGVFGGWFLVSTGGESIAITEINGVKTLYKKGTSNNFLGYVITTMPPEGAAPTGVDTGLTSVGLQLAYDRGRWIIEQVGADIGGAGSRTKWNIYDDAFNKTGEFYVAKNVVGWQLTTSPHYAFVPKTQGVALRGDKVIFGLGGSYIPEIDGLVSPKSSSVGVAVCNLDGSVATYGTVRADKLVTRLATAGYVSARTESEGISLRPDGTISHIVITVRPGHVSDTTDGILLFTEMDMNGEDYSDIAEPYVPFNLPRTYTGIMPRGVDGGIFNPLTNAKFTTLDQILQYMLDTQVPRMAWYSSAVTVTPIPGVDLPASCFVEVQNINNATFILSATVAGGGLKTIYAINATLGSSTYSVYREGQDVLRLRLADINSSTTDVSGKISTAHRSLTDADILSVHQQSTAGGNLLTLGGGSSLSYACSRIYQCVGDTLSTKGGTVITETFTNGFNPGAHLGFDLGTVGKAWKTVYAADGNFSGPVKTGQFTLATLPSASAYSSWLITVSDATGGAKVCRSNGTVWQILNTTTTVS